MAVVGYQKAAESKALARVAARRRVTTQKARRQIMATRTCNGTWVVFTYTPSRNKRGWANIARRFIGEFHNVEQGFHVARRSL